MGPLSSLGVQRYLLIAVLERTIWTDSIAYGLVSFYKTGDLRTGSSILRPIVFISAR